MNKAREQFEKMVKSLVTNKVITESQSSSFTPIIDYFEKELSESNARAAKAASIVADSNLDTYANNVQNYLKKIFESIDANNILRTKLIKAKTAKKVEKKIIESVDSYLNTYIEKLLPESITVDYARLHKLEKLFESFKLKLGVNDKFIAEAAKAVYEAAEEETNDDKDKIQQLESKINDLVSQCSALKNESKMRARNEALSKKLKDVPALEAKKVVKFYESEDCDAEEIERTFEEVLQAVKDALTDKTQDDAGIDASVSNILNGQQAEPFTEEEDEDEPVEESDEDDDEEEDDEDLTTESILTPNRLHESTAQSLMRKYINNSRRIKTI